MSMFDLKYSTKVFYTNLFCELAQIKHWLPPLLPELKIKAGSS